MQCRSHIMRKRGRSNEPDSGVDVTSLAGPAYDRELDVALMPGRSHGGPRYPWEVNRFLRDVLGPRDIPWLRPPTSLRSLSWAPPPVAPTGGEVWQLTKDVSVIMTKWKSGVASSRKPAPRRPFPAINGSPSNRSNMQIWKRSST